MQLSTMHAYRSYRSYRYNLTLKISAGVYPCPCRLGHLPQLQPGQWPFHSHQWPVREADTGYSGNAGLLRGLQSTGRTDQDHMLRHWKLDTQHAQLYRYVHVGTRPSRRLAHLSATLTLHGCVNFIVVWSFQVKIAIVLPTTFCGYLQNLSLMCVLQSQHS